MPSTPTSLHYHAVFSAKHRKPWFPPSVRSRVHEYLGGIVRGMNGVAHAAGGTGDHTHVIMGLSQNQTLASVMRDLKADSSKWIKSELGCTGFAWQEGYGAFTVSPPDLEKARKYALNQEEHHRKKSFQEE